MLLMRNTRKPFILVVAFFLLAVLVTAPLGLAEGEVVKLRILETTDLHVNLVNYDYYKDTAVMDFGLAMTATLVKKARAEVKNSLLLDNGDLLQGNPLGDYIAKVKGLKKGEIHPAFKAMNLLGYDAATLGNHEFNYGMDFLNIALAGAKFPYLSANVFIDDKDNNPSNDKYFVKPYVILKKTYLDETGRKQKLNVGIIGLTPPQIMSWDKTHLEGKLKTIDMAEAARKVVPMVKAKGADVIILNAHTGMTTAPAQGMDESAGYYLTQIPGVDAVLLGHSHVTFPNGKSFAGDQTIDNIKGLVNGVAVVQAGFWGNHLGVIDLTLTKTKGKFRVTGSEAMLLPIYDAVTKKPLVEPDLAVLDIVKTEHEGTVGYVRGAVGETTAPIHSFFALVQDDPSIQIVTNAQTWYVQKALKGTKYEKLPILSAGAPFKCGGRSGASYYTDIPKGTIAIKNVSDLYIYPNTVHAVLLTGTEIKEWLEWSAGQFHTIDINKSEEQNIVNNNFPTYNYDVIDGVTYQIDVTQPPRYDNSCKLINAGSERIRDLMYQGKPIDPKQEFVVATNNYRASFTKVANPDGKRIILSAPDENRQAIIDYINTLKTFNPSADNNWSFAPIPGNVRVVFESSPSAKVYAEQTSIIKFEGILENGFAKYFLDLSGGN